MSTAADSETQAPASTEAAILNAALTVLGERGFKGATTRLIAQRAGVNEVTLFRKFGTKLNLIQCAVEDKFSNFRESSVAYTGDIEADLARLATRYAQLLTELGPTVRVVLTEVHYEPDLARAIRGPAELFAAISDLLSRYQDDGRLRHEPAQSLVPAFLGPILMPYFLEPIAESVGVSLRVDIEQHVSGFLYGRSEPCHRDG